MLTKAPEKKNQNDNNKPRYYYAKGCDLLIYGGALPPALVYIYGARNEEDNRMDP